MAYVKECPCCDKKSYSSSNSKEWICPYCDKDISNVETKRAKN